MKKIFLILVVALMATVNASAQQIAVVTGSATQVCQTLKEAIECAQDGSVIYLPGGGFAIHDSVKINKQLTIMGISHKANSDNADGCTKILGNLFFNEGSSNSAICQWNSKYRTERCSSEKYHYSLLQFRCYQCCE